MAETLGVASFTGLLDLADRRLGGEALLTSDDFFAGCENLLEPGRGVFKPDLYTERGKWMDGWESRRRRSPGHDWAILRLGVPGVIRGLDIDTNHFLGNHAPYASVEACQAPADATPEQLRDELAWTELLPQSPLLRGSQNLFAVGSDQTWTHLRLSIYPDGGVARFRAYGEARPDWERLAATGADVDLAAAVHGGRAIACSDMFFSPMNNLLLPFPASDMGGGWESRRRRGPGEDWVVIELGTPGVVRQAVVDTAFFKGNFPPRCMLDGLYWPQAPVASLVHSDAWQPLLEHGALGADRAHTFRGLAERPVTHVRLRIAPCGGVSRLRLLGRPQQAEPGADALLAHLNGLDDAAALEALRTCCGAERWARGMVARRPFYSREQLFGLAEQVWWALGDGDWREAFTHHPQIGADPDALRARFAATADWSSQEQQGVAAASEATIQALAQANRDYLQRYGYIFIVCATGKTADQMLALLQARMHHEPADELRFAAAEQAKITRLRLEKLEPA